MGEVEQLLNVQVWIGISITPNININYSIWRHANGMDLYLSIRDWSF